VELEVTKAAEFRSSLTSLLRSCALLALIIAPTASLIAGLASRGFSSQSLIYAAIAGGICWFAASGALVCTYWGYRFRAPVQAVLAAMLLRMGLPLIALVLLPQLGGLLAGRELTTTILGVYLVTLILETLLAVRMAPQPAARRQAIQSI
jgi:hypothetical protein